MLTADAPFPWKKKAQEPRLSHSLLYRPIWNLLSAVWKTLFTSSKCFVAVKEPEKFNRHSWFIDADLLWTRAAVLNALATIQSLEELSITVFEKAGVQVPLPLEILSNLRAFSLAGTTALFEQNCEQLRKMALNNLHLRSLNLWNSRRSQLQEAIPLHRCFYGLGNLNITSLQLRGWQFLLEPLDATMFRSLTSLHLLMRGISPEIWALLESEGVQLTSLKVNVVSDQFLGYLRSFSGLQKLSLQGFCCPANDKADHFFNACLPLHSAFLRTLEIHPHFDSQWVLSEATMHSIAQCHRLDTLQLCLPTDVPDAEIAVRSFSFANGALVINFLGNGFGLVINIVESNLLLNPKPRFPGRCMCLRRSTFQSACPNVHWRQQRLHRLWSNLDR